MSEDLTFDLRLSAPSGSTFLSSVNDPEREREGGKERYRERITESYYYYTTALYTDEKSLTCD